MNVSHETPATPAELLAQQEAFFDGNHSFGRCARCRRRTSVVTCGETVDPRNLALSAGDPVFGTTFEFWLCRPCFLTWAQE